MKAKLTLTIEESIVESAKAYAAQKGQSLSAIFEKYILALTDPCLACTVSNGRNFADQFPEIEKLRGIITLPPDFNEEEIRYQRLTERYMK